MGLSRPTISTQKNSDILKIAWILIEQTKTKNDYFETVKKMKKVLRNFLSSICDCIFIKLKFKTSLDLDWTD